MKNEKQPRHYIANVAMAMCDPNVFESPLTFDPKRDVMLLRQKMGMAWAEPANGVESWKLVQEKPHEWASKAEITHNSPGCPGEKLSFELIRIFFKKWIDMHKEFEVILVEKSDSEFVDRVPFTPDLKFHRKPKEV